MTRFDSMLACLFISATLAKGRLAYWNGVMDYDAVLRCIALAHLFLPLVYSYTFFVLSDNFEDILHDGIFLCLTLPIPIDEDFTSSRPISFFLSVSTLLDL
jgi:hypothetical protein